MRWRGMFTTRRGQCPSWLCCGVHGVACVRSSATAYVPQPQCRGFRPTVACGYSAPICRTGQGRWQGPGWWQGRRQGVLRVPRGAQPQRRTAADVPCPLRRCELSGRHTTPSIGPHVRYWAFRGRWRCQFSGRQTAPNIGPRVRLDVMRLSILGRTAPHIGPQILGTSDDQGLGRASRHWVFSRVCGGWNVMATERLSTLNATPCG